MKKTGNKELIKRDYDYTVDGFKLTYNIRVFDVYEVEYEDEYGTFWQREEVVIDRFTMTDKEIEKDYNGIYSAMWRELEEEYNITKAMTA